MPSTRRKASASSSPKDDDSGVESPTSSSRKRVRRTVGKRRTAVKPKKKQSDPSDGDAMSSDNEGRSGVENVEVTRKNHAKSGDGDAAGSDCQPASSHPDSETKESGRKKAAKTTKKKRSPKKAAAKDDTGSGEEGVPKAAKPKKAKKAAHQQQTDRDELPKLWDPKDALEKHGSYTLKVMSWNVAGLRAVMKNHPTALPDLATKYGFDVIFLQETKLQEVHVDDPKLKINGHLLNDEGYDSYYSCATAKKGYSGTVAFVKRRNKGSSKAAGKKQASLSSFFKKSTDASDESARKNIDSADLGEIDVKNLIPENVSFGIGKAEHDAEGRSITLDFPLFTLTALYVPNSGQKLERLQYRTEEWDTDLLEFMQQKEKDRGVPVIWLGDLNVAHTGMETWNEGAKHLLKSAGTTPQE